jgi:hypothetical protein
MRQGGEGSRAHNNARTCVRGGGEEEEGALE